MNNNKIVEKKATDEYIKKVIELEKSHMKKHQGRRMTTKELNEMFGENV